MHSIKSWTSFDLGILVLCIVFIFSFQNCGFSTQSNPNLAPNSTNALTTPTPTPAPTATPQRNGVSVSQSTLAATTTATTEPLCTALGDFYWEVGDTTGKLGGGQIGTTYTATTPVAIASASKFFFGAYMVELRDGNFTTMEKQALQMQSGYTGLNPAICAPSHTVLDCLNAGSPGPNYIYTPSNVGFFYYDGAHDENFAVTSVANGGLGWGASTASALNTAMFAVLGINPGFGYAFPEFAGGITATADQFGAFLQAIVSKKLKMYDFLGANPVCTLPSACQGSMHSPAPVNWHYGYNHWIEDDAASDGAFSSPGAFGFYPWISKDKTLYGVLSRHDSTPGGGGGTGAAASPYWKSVLCGQKIRTAWITGVAQ